MFDTFVFHIFTYCNPEPLNTLDTTRLRYLSYSTISVCSRADPGCLKELEAYHFHAPADPLMECKPPESGIISVQWALHLTPH
ncbi:hypothetical protein CEXT_427131 [Caerostris extrusa]|uniref:Uncharacterized protein n=1 Tax=Caerostris extrusa TaxID=172846 RepID=A0AAV4RR86_CAEEX|nr:hypothetical protein CEXT_427131 [Caerostris extrusa]